VTSRERVARTLRFEGPDRPPRDLWLLEYAEMPEKIEQYGHLCERFPMDITELPVTPGRGQRARGQKGVVGLYTDDWGSQWRVAEPGVIGEVRAPALPDWAALDDYEPP